MAISEVKKRKVHGPDYKAKVGLRSGVWGNGVLLSDGYAVYASYARQVGAHACAVLGARAREVHEAKDIPSGTPEFDS